jgi:hypothetical protein
MHPSQDRDHRRIGIVTVNVTEKDVILFNVADSQRWHRGADAIHCYRSRSASARATTSFPKRRAARSSVLGCPA